MGIFIYIVVLALLGFDLIMFVRWIINNRKCAYNNRIIYILGGRSVGDTASKERKLVDDYETGGDTLVVGGSSCICSITLTSESSGMNYCAKFEDYLYIGREVDPNKALVVNGSGVSRVHCVLSRDNSSGQIYIQDSNSKYHTYLNGIEIAGMQPLNDADTITLGYETFFVTIN